MRHAVVLDYGEGKQRGMTVFVTNTGEQDAADYAEAFAVGCTIRMPNGEEIARAVREHPSNDWRLERHGEGSPSAFVRVEAWEDA